MGFTNGAKIAVSHQEVILMSTAKATNTMQYGYWYSLGDEAVEALIDKVRSHMSIMFKICEAVAMLDMVYMIEQSMVSTKLMGSRLRHSRIWLQ